MYRKPSFDEVFKAAHDAIRSLGTLGYRSCVIGDLACNLFGTSRRPEDADIVIFGTRRSSHSEELKRQLVSLNANFYLRDPKNASATYKSLWYRLPSWSCRVNLLASGIQDIPNIDASCISYVKGIPVMPLSIVLLLKLQSWICHRISSKPYLRIRQYADMEDIDFLLPLACEHRLKPCEEPFVRSSFILKSRARAWQYTVHYPASAERWRALGFIVCAPTPPPVHISKKESARPVKVATKAVANASTKVPKATIDAADSVTFEAAAIGKVAAKVSAKVTAPTRVSAEVSKSAKTPCKIPAKAPTKSIARPHAKGTMSLAAKTPAILPGFVPTSMTLEGGSNIPAQTRTTRRRKRALRNAVQQVTKS
ncbi:hypothetical protein DFH11DRAFT_1857739 [Phellopilus nigrolimitatus]|nr:hypothetical protein DFH11DRAFT_1857739 [Phellopilus nigrolimitatus]